MRRRTTLWFLALLPLVLATVLRVTALAQTDRAPGKFWSRVGLAAPAAVPVVSDKPVQHYPSTLRVGDLPPQDSPDVQISTLTTITQSENSIFVNPLDNMKVLNSNNSSDYPVSTIYGASGFMSTDGGLTWSGSQQGTGGANSGDPAVAIDLGGRYFNNYIAADGGNGNAWSTNNGTTWTHVQVAPLPGPGGLADKNHMWVDNSPSSPYNGNLYAAWTDFGGTPDNQIAVSRSTDHGLTWSAKSLVSTAVAAGSHNQGVNVQTGPNGQVYVTWAVYDAWPAAEAAIGFAKSTDGGVTWQPATRALTNIKGIRSQATGGGLLGGKDQRTASFPSMTVNMQNGSIYIVWANIGVPGTNTGTERDVYVAKSVDGGTTWGTPVRVNQDTFNNGKDQWFPWIACDPVSGALVVAFYDSRDFAANDQANTYCAVSYDGGTTWEDFRVSDASWSGDGSGTGFSSNYAGDYIGVAIRNGRAYPCWTDRRESGGRLSTWVSPFLVYPPNAGFVKGIVTTTGSPLAGVTIDFTNPVTQIPSTTDAAGYYKASASVEPGTTSLLTIRAQKFGYITKTETVTVVRADTVTRNLSLTTAPGGTLTVHAYKNDNSGIRAGVQVKFNGNTVVSDSTNGTTGLLSVPLPTGSYTVVVDPPSPYGTRTFTGITINAGQTTTVQSLVRYVLEPSPTAVRDTLVVGQIHAKTLNLTNTTPDTVRYRITDDNALLKVKAATPRPATVRQYEGYELPKGAVDPHPGIAAPEGRGGPDVFGYEWIDSDEPGGPTYSWTDISGTGTLITGWLGSADDGRQTIPLPFSFPFYGTSYDSVKVVTNGWISFATTSISTAYSNSAIPSSAEPNNAVYMFWDDLDLSTSGTVHYLNDVANSRFIIQYTNVPHFGTSTPGLYTFQVILRPNGTILVQYASMQQTLNSATLGIENGTGTDGLQVVFNATYVHDNMAVQYFVPDAPWISESPITGTLAPGANQNITVTFDATGLITGNLYNAVLFVDPDHPDVAGTIDVPASLKVQLASSAVLILNKSTITFPATQINTTRRDTIVAKNGGATTLTISSITRTNTDFTVSPSSATLVPGDSVKVPVTYTPTAVGADTGRVVFLSNSQGTPRMDVILNGTAIGAPAISVAPTTVVDTLQTGTTHTKQFTVTNTTPAPTTPLYVSLAESAPWLSVSPAADTLAGAESGPFTIAFDATGLALGVYTTSISITSNDPATPTTSVACTLRVVGGPVIVTRPDTLRRTLQTGAQGTDTLIIKNTGVLPLTWTLTEAPSVPPQRPRTGPAPAAVPLPKDAKDPGTGGPVTEGQGGPDGYGYRWIDSDEPGGPAFNWVDISGVGTPITTWTGTGDDGHAIVPIPFSFPFYGTGYTQLKVATNGFVSLDVVSTDHSFSNATIPSAAEPNLSIYPWWDDLDVRTNGTIHYYYDAPNSRFIVQYTNVPHYGTTTPGIYTFQVILNASGSVLCQYLDMQQTLNSATIGIENADGSTGLQVVYNAAYVHNTMAILFSRGISWLAEGTTGGTIGTGDSAKVPVTFDATGLANGVYTGVLQIASNDFNHNPKNVPVRLTVGSSGTVSVSLNQGWNMVSNPVVTASDSVRQLFPTSAFTYAFGYTPGVGYAQHSRLLNGTGYWEKFPTAATQSISGSTLTTQSVALSAGWNLVGSVSSPIDTSDATTVPAGLRVSPFFEFGTGYTPTATIMPGRAYWVKSSGAGTMTMSSVTPVLSSSAVQADEELGQMSTLTVSDAAGNAQMLYIGRGAQELAARYELPPPGPEGAFDVRFESQRMVEVLDPEARAARTFSVSLRSLVAPVTVHWNVKAGSAALQLGDGLGGAVFASRTLTGSGSAVLRGTGLTRFVITAAPDGVPATFALDQNYPNPFNPSTRISYAVAEPSLVTLAVFDVLGRRVATLQNERMSPGFYSAEWDGRNDADQAVASGIYFSRIEATAASGVMFRSAIKMLLMK